MIFHPRHGFLASMSLLITRHLEIFWAFQCPPMAHNTGRLMPLPNLRRHYRSHGSSHCLPLITGGLADSEAILTAVTENWILIARAVTPPPAAHTPIFFFGTRIEVSKHSNTELDPVPLFYERLKRQAQDVPGWGRSSTEASTEQGQGSGLDPLHFQREKL